MAGPRVDFYVLPDSEPRARLVYACRLVEKAWQQQHRVYVRLDSRAEAEALDELLWTFADRSFVPHELARAGVATGAPVLVGDGAAPDTHLDLLVNLAAAVPADHARFARIAELVDADDGRRRLGRERFRYYRDQGLAPESHTVGSQA